MNEGQTTQGQTETTSQGATSVESVSSSPASQTATPQSTSNAQPSKAPSTSPVPSVTPEGAQAPSIPQWQPNFKFKAAGKEHEIPEYLRPFVKDAETEKQLKELHEKAYGLDLVKNNYQNAQAQVQQFQKTILPEYTNLKKTVQSVIMFRNNGDIDSVLETIGLPLNVVAQHLLKKAQLNEMSPEQRAVYENEQALRKQNYALQERVASLSQGQEQYQLQSRATELQTALARPDVLAVAESFNTRLGNQDAFWNYVCQQADFMERSTGQRVTAEQAITETLKILGTSVVPQPGQQAGVNPPPAGGAPQSGQGTGSPTPPVIPNVTGARNASPTKKIAKSVDDLRRMAQEMSKGRSA